MTSIMFPHILALAATAVCALTDARTGRIYNKVTIPAMLIALAYHAVFSNRSMLVASVLGLAMGLVPFALAALRGWIGAGDVKLFGAIGAALGATVLIDVLFVTFVLAAAFGVVMLWRREGAAGTLRRIGGGVRMLVRGTRVDEPDESTGPTLRLGIFAFLGTLLVVGGIWLTR